MTGRIQDVLLGPDTHANRPSATTVANGTLYSCTTHSIIYRSDSATWSTWASVGASGAVLLSTVTTAGDLIVGSGSGAVARLGMGSALQTLRVNAAGTALEYAAPSASPWAKNLDQSFASSMSDLTALTGTWAISGGVLTQTDTSTSATRRARSTAKYGTDLIAIQVECRMISGTGAARRMGIIPQYEGSSVASFPYFYIAENGSGTWTYEAAQDAVVGRGSVAGTGAYNTWRTILVEYSSGDITAYVDGTLIGTFVNTMANTSFQPYFGLGTYAASCEFRNLKVWNLAIPT